VGPLTVKKLVTRLKKWGIALVPLLLGAASTGALTKWGH